MAFTERRLTAMRRTLLWVFQPPATPYVGVNGSFDVATTMEYLQRVGSGISLQHLLAASIGVVLREFPAANAVVIGKRIVDIDGVGVAMPVNLIGHDDRKGEVGFTVLDRVDSRSLKEVAEHCRTSVAQERSGKPSNPFVSRLLALAEQAPHSVFERTLNAVAGGLTSRRLFSLFHTQFPATTMLSNVGAIFGKTEGVMVRGLTFFVPPQMAYFGTLWATAVIQEEVIPIAGVPVVRPMLPVMFMFDHRLIDGVLAGRILLRFGEILANPEYFFGVEGQRRPGEVRKTTAPA